MKNVLKIIGKVNVGEAIPCDQIPGCTNGGEGSVGLGAADTVVGNIMTWAFYILGIVGVIILIYGGIQFMMSQGDAGKAQKARQTIIYAIIGIIVVIAAGAITRFVLENVG